MPGVRAWGVLIGLALTAAAHGCGAARPPYSVVPGDQDDDDDDDDDDTDGGGKDAARDRDARQDGEPDPGPAPSITVGAPDRILLVGTLLTPAVAFEGQVLVEGDRITCVAPGTECETRAGASGATVIDTQGVIAPGLIDTHNHILFDIFDDDDWTPDKIYQNHDAWTSEPRYQNILDVKQCLANDSQGKPVWCTQTPYGTVAGSLRCEMNKWGELKGLVAGTTSIVGLPGTSAACFGSLARSIDVIQNGLGFDRIQTSAIFPPSSPSNVCQNFASGQTDAYLVHCGEGIDTRSLGEFSRLGTLTTPASCLYAPQTAITHGTAFTAAEFSIMANNGMKLVWSPKSNWSLYRQTANIPVALDAGVTVALAPDWSMGGSQNLLDELRFASEWSRENWNERLTPVDLVKMVTSNASQVLALDRTIGVLEEGAIADIAVFAGDRSAPYDALIAARPRNVRLVMVGGVVLYGDPILEPAAPAQPGCEAIDVCGAAKFLCVATTSSQNKLNQTHAEIQQRLEQALLDTDVFTSESGFSFAPLAPLVRCDP